MSENITYLSPNGQNVTYGTGTVTRILAGRCCTSRGRAACSPAATATAGSGSARAATRRTTGVGSKAGSTGRISMHWPRARRAMP